MSDKTFLQDLQSLKNTLSVAFNDYKFHKKDIEEPLKQSINDVQAMVDQCLEIQLAMMKIGKMIDVKG